MSGAAAEKIYRTHGPDAEISVRLDVKPGAALRWLPQETILFDRTRVTPAHRCRSRGCASLVLAEAIVFGRSAMGEAVHDGKLSTAGASGRMAGLIFAETLNLDGAIAQKLSEKAVGRRRRRHRDLARHSGR